MFNYQYSLLLRLSSHPLGLCAGRHYGFYWLPPRKAEGPWGYSVINSQVGENDRFIKPPYMSRVIL